jgi:hypothetical protein
MIHTNFTMLGRFQNLDKSQAKSRMGKAVEGQEITIEIILVKAQRRVEINQTVEIPIEASHAEGTTNPDKIANEVMFSLKYDRNNPLDGHQPFLQPASMHSR